MKPPSSELSRRIVLLAAAQGVAGDALLRVGPWGVNLAVWAALGIAGLGLVLYPLSRSRPLPDRSPDRGPVGIRSRSVWLWLAMAGTCAVLVAVRAAEALTALTVLAGAGCLAMAAWSARGGRPMNAAWSDHAAQAVGTALFAGLGGFSWLARGVPAGSNPRCAPAPPRIGWRLGFGFLGAVPVLVVFGGLFASADPVFARSFRVLTDVDFPTLASHAFLVGAWGWVTLGYVSRLLLPPPFKEPETFAPAPPTRVPSVEVVTGLSLLAALFLAFVLVQARYLFGGDDRVVATAGLTYAEYARRGFFELLGVAALLIPLLLASDWLLAADARRRTYRVLASILLFLLAVIMVSAWKRLGLYTGAYGWTEPRFYAAAALVALALTTVWFLITVIPGHRERFTGGVVCIALATLLGLHAANPDAFIGRHNLARAAGGASFDVKHALHLGADAVPVLWRGMDVLNDEDRRQLRKSLVRRWAMPIDDWRVWNCARAKARETVCGIQRTHRRPIP